MVHNVLIGLSDSMGNQLVSDTPAVHKEMLEVCLTTRKCGQPHPTP